jgi:hypothetical protein
LALGPSWPLQFHSSAAGRGRAAALPAAAAPRATRAGLDLRSAAVDWLLLLKKKYTYYSRPYYYLWWHGRKGSNRAITGNRRSGSTIFRTYPAQKYGNYYLYGTPSLR